MDAPDPGPPSLPRPVAALLCALLPRAERHEVVADLADEYGSRRRSHGVPAARRWLWRQVLGSLPALLRRGWWRGATGFEPRANRMRPGGPMFESWIMDARYAARRLASRPTYALLAVLTLALGAGGAAAIFGVARSVLLEPLPYASEEEVAVFWMPFSWSEEEFLHFRDDVPGFRQVAAYREYDLTLERESTPVQLVPGMAASAELFDVLGAAPLLGRAFRPGDDRTGAEPVVVLSHGLWQELGGGADVVGRRLRLGGAERTVVGVMPPGFWFPDPSVRIWSPAPLSPESRSGRYTLVGRVNEGATPAATQAALGRFAAALGERFDYPVEWDKSRSPAVTPIRDHVVGSVRPALLATLAAIGVILLIAAANVAALMLGQVDGRSTELAVRSALGAGRRRLTQQLVIEAVLVGLLAGLVGAGLATVGFHVLVGALPLGALATTATLDWTLFGAALATAVLAALVVSLVPASAVWRGRLRDSMARSRTGGVGGRGSRLEGGLVVAQVALAVLLAAGAGLLVRSVAKLQAIDPGVETRGVAVLDLMLASVPPAERHQAVADILGELGALPGVRAAAVAQRLPLRGGGDNWGISVEGRPDLDGRTTALRVVSHDYLDALGMRVRRGRGFTASDRPTTERVVVVNEALAEQFFPGEDPVGRRLAGSFDGAETIIGVVSNAAETTLTDAPAPARYMLFAQVPYTPATMSVVLALERPEAVGPVIESARGAVSRAAPRVAVRSATTMEQLFALAVGPARQVRTLLATLTALALALGAIGVYGVISHFVARRQREYSVRIALGLVPARVVSEVVGRGGRLVLAGAAIGVVAALALSRLLGSFLYGVEATDPLAMTGAVVLLFAVGVVAALIPARRASRLDPAASLRAE